MPVSTLDSVYRKVLSAGNKEANQMYPPHIFDEHFNIATNFILDECVRRFPTDKSIIEIIRPFLRVKFDKLTNGILPFPEDFRNLLGVSIHVKNSDLKPCDCEEKIYVNDPLALTKTQLDAKMAEVGCNGLDVTMVDISEFNKRTSHPYKRPDKNNFKRKPPVGCIFGLEDDKKLGVKICPFDLSHAEIYYVRKPKEYQLGYTQMPDETFIPNKSTTTESEWEDTAMQYLVKAVSTLYAAYTRDSELRDFNMELKKIGLF